MHSNNIYNLLIVFGALCQKMSRNARELMDWPFELKIPLRIHQLEICRWAFVVSYAIIGMFARTNVYIEISIYLVFGVVVGYTHTVLDIAHNLI